MMSTRNISELDESFSGQLDPLSNYIILMVFFQNLTAFVLPYFVGPGIIMSFIFNFAVILLFLKNKNIGQQVSKSSRISFIALAASDLMAVCSIYLMIWLGIYFYYFF